ncbi:hypothetical protein Acr_24g0006500 [Actinidia rufa]|uniref:Uncharacterized protein n=1 Tax=Actinidia rufa TaxID=165716 RepID=A0A7J0GUE2_9ERIC|nr:hypothetical protein Acr_24g0006500 [Actinidia rufa]
MGYHYKVSSVVPCAGARCRPLYTGLARGEISVELSLQNKLGEPPRRSSEKSLSKTTIVRAKTIVTFELSLFNKLGIIIVLELGHGATADGNLERCQETRVTCMSKFLLTAPMLGWRSRQLMMSY